MATRKTPAKKAQSPALLMHTGRVVGTAVGIETYQPRRDGSQLPKVHFAKEDAEAFATTIRSVFDGADINVLIDSDATLTSLQYEVKQVLGGLQEGDLFIFYYAGHGYHDPAGNRITCWDSNSFNPADTTLLLRDLLIEPLRESKCQRALVFIDACATAIRGLVKSRDVVADLNPQELREFLKSAQYCATFLSCRPGQKSFPSEEHRHGVWTYFLLRALRGDAEEALGPRRFLTDSGLRDYLAQVVPRYVTAKKISASTQNPVAILDGTHTFAILEVPEQQVELSEAGDFSGVQFEVIEDFLEAVDEKNFTSLPNFNRRRHFVPDVATEATDRFMRERLQETIDEEIKDLYQAAKESFGLRARDFEQSATDANGLLECEFFRYSVTPRHLSSDASCYRVTRRLQLRSGWESRLEAFDAVFDRMFERVVARFKPNIGAYDDLVERFEDVENEHGGKLDEDASNSTLTYVDEERRTIRIDLAKGRLEISGPSNRAPVSDQLELARRFRFGLSGAPILMLKDR